MLTESFSLNNSIAWMTIIMSVFSIQHGPAPLNVR